MTLKPYTVVLGVQDFDAGLSTAVDHVTATSPRDAIKRALADRSNDDWEIVAVFHGHLNDLSYWSEKQ